MKPQTLKVNGKGNLEASGCDICALADKYSTPLYVIDEKTLRTACREYKNAFKGYKNIKFLFASKSLCTMATSKIFSEEKFGFDAVSGGEIYTIHKSGVDMKKVLFNGNNKSVDELVLALELGVGRISVDNFFELSLINEIAHKYKKHVDILLRIIPGIECHTHKYIQTGGNNSKFGFDMSEIETAVQVIKDEYKNLNLKGLHAHVGSQIFEKKIYSDEIDILIPLMVSLNKKYSLKMNELNIGGGLGVKYVSHDNPPSTDEIAEVIIKSLEINIKKFKIDPPLVYLEPGRSLISPAGITLYTVGAIKQTPDGTKYVCVDGGMADNPRPSLYQAKYTAQIANKPLEKNTEKVTIAGRFCESGDILIKDIKLPEVEEGDVLCVYNTGAYNYSMASNYNRVSKPAMVLVNNGKSDIIVKRETLQDIVRNDKLPKRLGGK
ncbi:diaminopimelate decarboxylase [bacterium]|nr:diaminopimelate decarboxylase [bacterium]